MALPDGRPVTCGMGGPGFARAAIVAALLIGAQPAAGQEGSIVTIATAGHGGVYLPAGNAICQLVNAERERHGIRCIARASAGSVENIEALRAGERSYAIVQSDIQNAALKGSRQFERAGPLPDLRALFSLHAEPFTVVVPAGSDIQSFAEVKERRIALGVEGSGMRATAEDILEAFGFGEADRARMPKLPPGEQIEALCEGRIEAATFVVGHPSGYLQDATNACGGRLIPVEGPAVQRLLADAPYYAPAVIAARTYRGQPQDVPTFGVRATVVTLAERPEPEVYELVQAVFSNLELLRRLHPALADLDRSEMVGFGNTAPLHPGAKRYFREAGLLR
jgi:TRAP transporter TAXI family solute receptor